MIHAIALDDEPPALDILHLYCDKLGSISLDKVFSNTDEAYKYLEKFPVDVLFLDINMPSVSGIEFYKMLPHKVLVIFTTSYSEYAVESYNLNAVDYLLKPFSFSRFEQAVKKAEDLSRSQLLNTSELPFLMLRADYSLVKIVLNEILFIEGLDNYLKIHLDSQNPCPIGREQRKMRHAHRRLRKVHIARVAAAVGCRDDSHLQAVEALDFGEKHTVWPNPSEARCVPHQ